METFLVGGLNFAAFRLDLFDIGSDFENFLIFVKLINFVRLIMSTEKCLQKEV